MYSLLMYLGAQAGEFEYPLEMRAAMRLFGASPAGAIMACHRGLWSLFDVPCAYRRVSIVRVLIDVGARYQSVTTAEYAQHVILVLRGARPLEFGPAPVTGV